MAAISTSASDPRALVDATLGPQTARLAALRCAVLGGGSSPEREVSLVSARGIAAALAQPTPRCPQALADVSVIELDAQDAWRVGERALQPTRALEALADIDVFFLGLHGGSGEDGTLQGLLSSAGRAFTGSGVGASAVCMDKWLSRAAAASIGVRVAAGVRIGARDQDLAAAAALAASSGCVVKPRRGGSSVATSVLRRPAPGELREAVLQALACRDEALVEELVPGVEITVPVLRSAHGAVALMPVEIRPADGHFFDYQQKYAADGARELCPPEWISPEEVTAAQRAALQLHELFGCGSYSRTDFIVARAGPHSGQPVFLEVNTLPGFTPRSLLPQSARWHGIEYRELCLFLLLEALA